MKTKEQASYEALSQSPSYVAKNDSVFHEGFARGIEFSQQWIPVKEELPEKYQNVLLKEDSGSIYVGFYGGNSELPICRATESRLIAITHWRPISFL